MIRVRLMFFPPFALLCSRGRCNGGSGRSVQVSMDNVRSCVQAAGFDNLSRKSEHRRLTVIDSRHVFVMGKRFGATNLIALVGRQIRDCGRSRYGLEPHAEAVTIFRGPDTFNYVCTQLRCETNPVPGDPDGSPYFDNTQKERDAHEQEAAKAASGGGQQSGGVH